MFKEGKVKWLLSEVIIGTLICSIIFDNYSQPFALPCFYLEGRGCRKYQYLNLKGAPRKQ